MLQFFKIFDSLILIELCILELEPKEKNFSISVYLAVCKHNNDLVRVFNINKSFNFTFFWG